MKKSLYYLCFFTLTLILLTSCKKESTGKGGGNFNPLTTGTHWTYKHTETGTADLNYTLTVTGRDTSANGKTYKVLASSLGQNTYLAKVGSDNFRFASIPSIGINSFEELFLKEDKGVNDTWSNSVSVNLSGIPLIGNLNYTIKGKGENRTVNGKSFDNVTYVRLDLSLSGLTVGGGDFYYQDGVGMIENVISVSQPALAFNSRDQIVDYEVK